MVMSKLRNRKLFIIIFCILCLGYFICYKFLTREKQCSHTEIGDTNPQCSSADRNYENNLGLILNDTFCRIPRTPLFPPYFESNWRKENIPDCSSEVNLGEFSEDGTKYILLEEYRYTNCTAAEILRQEKWDNGYTLSKWRTIPIEIDVRNWEFFVISCGESLNFEARLTREKIKAKEEFWKESGSGDKINVIILGIDTVSRSHAFRSLPKTMKLFDEMGFHDFRAYHSLAPSTLTNFMGFLMGLPRPTVRATCSPNFESPFDTCPFIWKEYAKRNYVTMYLEDSSQTFNWGNQSGFMDQPTDYYAHHFFYALDEIKSEALNVTEQKEKDVRVYCTSQESVPEFVTRYTQKFIETMSDLPFFAFTWYASPFHDYEFTLQNMDDQLLAIYKFILSSPNLLQNTLLIFVSDHGDRFGFSVQKGMDGYIERGLPPLFIRIPEKLIQLQPKMNLNQVMEANSQKLVSPFDIHHTLLHLLQLTRNQDHTAAENFISTKHDRSSLFVPINREASCESFHVFPDSCVCNTVLKGPSLDPSESPPLNEAVLILEQKLNNMLVEGGYGDLCREWTVPDSGVLSIQVLKKIEATNTTEVFIRFAVGAIPKDAIFEAKMRLNYDKTGLEAGEVLGKIVRINSYGDQSDCLPSVTDLDKEMKEYCYCRNKPMTILV